MVNPISNKNEVKKGLYLVPTPIGNLGDITFRSLEILKNSDYILCEDTRVSKNLFNKFEIKTKVISYLGIFSNKNDAYTANNRAHQIFDIILLVYIY